MAQFSKALSKTKQAEGGYQNIRSDRGNVNSLGQYVGTNHGISAKTAERVFGVPPSTSFMKNLPWFIAKAIYRELYWDQIKGDDILSQQVAEILFDAAVNHGVRSASRMLQRAIGFVKTDGIIGPITLDAMSQCNMRELFEQIKNKRIASYKSIARRYPRMNEWLNGWIKRVEKYEWSEDRF